MQAIYIGFYEICGFIFCFLNFYVIFVVMLFDRV